MTWDITDRNIIVTGGNSGIGMAAATALAQSGANVTITARDRGRGEEAASTIATASGADVAVLHLDLADLSSVRDAASTYTEAHTSLAVLVNNAGAVFGKRRTTVDGFERTIGTNHLGPFLFTSLLTDLLLQSSPARVINVASSGHGFAKEGIQLDDLNLSDQRYRVMRVYGHSKLANMLHAREFDRRYGSAGVAAYAMHPGLVRSSFGRDGDSPLVALGARAISRRMISAEDGADTIVWLATTEAPIPSGGYFEQRSEGRSTNAARDDEAAFGLWQMSEQLVGLGPSSRTAS